MKKNIQFEKWMTEMIRTLTNMYNHGWDERNGGNVSMLIDEEQVAKCLDPERVIRRIPTGFTEPSLAGKYFLVTGTGKYFKNVQYEPGTRRSFCGGSRTGARLPVNSRLI